MPQHAAAATFVWDGNGTGATTMNSANNWNPNGVPAATAGDIGQFDGTVAGNLALSTNGPSAGTNPWSISVTGGQDSNLTVDSGSVTNALRLYNITIDAGAFETTGAGFFLGSGSGAAQVNLGNATAPYDAGNTFTNNSAATATIQSDMLFNSGSATQRTLTFDGSGNWTVATVLGITASSGVGSMAVAKNGTGILYLSAANTFTGGITLASGELQMGTNTSLSTGALTINGGNLVARLGGRNLSNAVNVGADFGIGNVGNSLTLSGGMNLGGATRIITVVDGSPVTDATFSGVVSNGGLTKMGPGTLALSGTNTFSGPVLVSEGTLNLNNANPIDSAISVTVNGSGAKLTVGNAATVAQAVTLTQGAVDGLGTFNTLNVADAVGNVVAAGNGTAGALNVGTLTFQGAATVNLTTTGPTSGQTIFVTNLTTSPSADVVLNVSSSNGAWLDNTDYYLIQYLNYSSAADASHFTLNPPPGLNANQTATLVNTGGAIVMRITTQALIWTGFQNSNWTTVPVGGSRNWSENGLPVEFASNKSAIFDESTGNFTVNIAENVSPFATSFNNDSNDYTVSSTGGFGISTGSLVKNGFAKTTLTTNNTYTGPTSINGGTLEVSGSIATSSSVSIVANASLILDVGGSPYVYGNPISGGGNVVKNGSGVLTLSGANTFTGKLELNGGALNVNGPSALGAGAGALEINGGSIDNTSGSEVIASTNKPQSWNADVTFTGSSNLDMGSGTVTLRGGVDRIVTPGGAGDVLTVGEIKSAGNEGLTISGGGTLVATSIGSGTAGSSIGGVLNVASGTTLQMNRSAATGGSLTGDFVATGLTGSGTILNGATGTTERLLRINSSDNQTFSGTLANGGTAALGLEKLGTGSLVLNGSTSYTGETRVTAGSLVMSSSNSATSLIEISPSTTLTVTNAAATGAGPITSVTSGARQVNLHINGGGTLGNSLMISSGHTVTIDVDRNDDSSTGGEIRLTGVPTGGGNATFNITGANGYRLAINDLRHTAGVDGTVTFNPTTANVSIGTMTSISMTPHSYIMGLAGTSGDNSVTGVIGSLPGTSFALTKSGSSTWTLSNANLYTGATLISEGTLRLGDGTNDGTIASSASITNNAALVLNWVGNHTITQAISGSGSLTKNGAGTATLAGVNTYTGTTTINAGEIAVNGTSIADAGTVAINGGKLNLTSIETVDKLFFGGVPQPAGTYTAASDGTHFSGAGSLIVTSSAASGFSSWASANGATGQTPEQDHDNDGVANGIEFFVGGGTGFTALPTVVTNAGVRTVTWPKSAAYTGSYVVQVSSDLTSASWSPAGAGTVVDNGSTVVFTFPAGPAIRFVRLNVTPN